ncbi:MAG: hypothetical protein KAI47_26770 [Deltaproteobacteria bacterium]|nr:hypothetical protein [Deltaproteobacteria bacterium]
MTYQGPAWKDRVSGYETATFPVMPDVKGEVYVRYGADVYDVFLIDRQGRIASRFVGVYDDMQFPQILNKLRDLHAE